jgi:homoprotocatechuate degradation regulator HpaR
LDKFNKSLPMMLHRTLDAVIPKYRAVFKEHDISEQQWRILRVLWEVPSCTSAELARVTLLPSPSMVGIIDRMMKKSLVLRDRSEDDRRIVHLSLTDKGRQLQNELMPQIDAIYDTMIKQCDADAWQTMIDTMQIIIDTNQPS